MQEGAQTANFSRLGAASLAIAASCCTTCLRPYPMLAGRLVSTARPVSGTRHPASVVGKRTAANKAVIGKATAVECKVSRSTPLQRTRQAQAQCIPINESHLRHHGIVRGAISWCGFGALDGLQRHAASEDNGRLDGGGFKQLHVGENRNTKRGWDE